MGESRAGQVLAGRYELVTALGGGGAEVWRGVDQRLGRPVVVKLARIGMLDREAARFENEMRLLAGARHPNVVTLYDAGTADGRPYLVMEDVPGGSLAEALSGGPLSSGRVLDLAVGIADALAYLHAAGIAHRDLKPGNVLLDVGGRPHVADLGIARTVDAARLTGTGNVIGTPAYLAPEQVQGDLVTSKCDQYAFGLMLLECLTGRREYTGSSIEAAMARLNRPPVIPGTLPMPWPGLIAELTAMDPVDRPTATDVAARLRALRGDEYSPATEQIVPPAVAADDADLTPTEVTAAAPITPAAVPAPAPIPAAVATAVPPRKRNKRWLVAVPATAVAAGAGVLIAMATLSGNDPDGSSGGNGTPDTAISSGAPQQGAGAGGQESAGGAGQPGITQAADNGPIGKPTGATANPSATSSAPGGSSSPTRTTSSPTQTSAPPTTTAAPTSTTAQPTGTGTGTPTATDGPTSTESAGASTVPTKVKKPKKPKK